MKKKYIIIFCIGVVIFGLLFYFYLRQKIAYNARTYVVWVNGEGITRSDYAKELSQTKQFFIWAKQDVIKLPSLDHDVLERMIEMKIVSQYAKKNKITVSQKEVEDYYLAGLGKKSEAEFLATVKKMYGMEKGDYLQKISGDLLKEKVQLHLKKPLVSWLKEMKKSLSISSIPSVIP